jgi:hypothetical protein
MHTEPFMGWWMQLLFVKKLFATIFHLA